MHRQHNLWLQTRYHHHRRNARTQALKLETHRGPFLAAELAKFTVHIIEIGYGSDTKWRETYDYKYHQHWRLTQALTNENWKVIIHPIVFGRAGTIYTHAIRTLMTLGVHKTSAHTCLDQINVLSVQYAHSLIVRAYASRKPP